MDNKKYKYSVFGVSTDNDDKKFNDLFKFLYEDGEQAVYETVETYHHEDETSFDYKYIVEVYALDSRTGDGMDVFAGLFLVPTLDSLSKSKRENVLRSSGVEESECITADVFSYGCSVTFGSEKVAVNTSNPFSAYTETERCLEAIANVLSTIDSLRGFYLDKPQNRMGEDGWDYLHRWLED